MNPTHRTEPWRTEGARAAANPARPSAGFASSRKVPPYALLTNDDVELLHPELQVSGEALRYTHHGYHGLFGGIWRRGLVSFTPRFGTCLGPEVFYPVGATTRESRAAFDCSRAEALAIQARLARAAFRFVEPVAEELGGAAFLNLVKHAGDRHVLHVFLPVAAVARRFTPRDWFLFWRIQDEKFRHGCRTPGRTPSLIGSCA